jgi:hypothetical protein
MGFFKKVSGPHPSPSLEGREKDEEFDFNASL